jgi:ribosome-associated protein
MVVHPVRSSSAVQRRPRIDADLTTSTVDTSTDRLQSEAAAHGASRDRALQIADVISETPAADTLVLDISGLSPVADYFVICSGENERQLRAIQRTLLEELGEKGFRPERREGSSPSGWILLDYGDVIVHVFDREQRGYYRLEELWSEAQTLLAIQ